MVDEFDEDIEGASFNSPLGRMKIAKNAQQRVLSVEDKSDSDMNHGMDPNFDEDNVFEKKDFHFSELQKFKQKPSISQKDKTNLELLAGIGKASTDVDVDGVSFTIRTLKNKELRFSVLNASKYDLGTEQAFEIRTIILAFAITHINGNELGLILGNNSFKAKYEYISDLDEVISTFLYKKYQELTISHKAKYNLNTKEGVKEVSKDLKKS